MGKPSSTAQEGAQLSQWLCVEVHDEHISVIESALRGEEMMDCNIYWDDVGSRSLKVENPSMLYKSLRDVTLQRYG